MAGELFVVERELHRIDDDRHRVARVIDHKIKIVKEASVVHVQSSPAFPLPPLAKAFVQQEKHVCALFSPITSATDAPCAPRAQVVDAIEAFHVRLGTRYHHPAIARSLVQLRASDVTVVVGGQQPMLFAGPLYVLYKAVSILRIAEERRRTTGKAVVPVFWLAGEDHDWDECNHVHLLAGERPSLHKVTIDRSPPPNGNRPSISQTTLTRQAWDACIADIIKMLPATSFTADVHRWMQQWCMDDDEGVPPTATTVCARALASWFGAYGLVLLDAADPALRLVEAPLFHRLLTEDEAVHQALSSGTQAVARSGYPVQAPIQPHCMHVFMAHEGRRTLLFRDGETITDRHGNRLMTRAALHWQLEKNPAAFSNHALTRPLMQQFLLPVCAVVVGPSELAYWAQLREAFALLQLPMPPCVLREHVTVVERTAQKQLEKFRVRIADLLHDGIALRKAWLAQQEGTQLTARFDAIEKQFVAAYETLLQDVCTQYPSIQAIGHTNLEKIVQQIHFLARKTEQAHTIQHEAGLHQWDRLLHGLLPAGEPQERVHHVISFCNKYGLEWTASWMDTLIQRPVHPDIHTVVYL